jgi:radical SAM protein with 4Fe4S-binding SPASM domain
VNKETKQILKKIFPLIALQNLRGFIEAINSYYPDYLFGKGRIRRLRAVSIEVTFRCNCRCQMCPLYGVQTNGGKELIDALERNRELTVDEFKKLFIDLKELKTESVEFTGGEAFLRKDILDITKLAKQSGFRVSFITNGGMITKEIARELVRLEVDSIVISLDGPKEVHENIRKAKIFDHIMEVVNWINDEKKGQGKILPTLTFLCTVSALNQMHLVELLKVANKARLPLTIDPIIFTSKEDAANTRHNFQEDFIKQETFTMPKEIGAINVEAYEDELNRVFFQSKKLNQPVSVSVVGEKTRKKFFNDPNYSIVNKCLLPWDSARIDPYGNVYPCSLSVSMGNLRDKSIKDVVNGRRYVEFRNRLKKQMLFPFCKKCCALYSQNIFWNFLPKF